MRSEPERARRRHKRDGEPNGLPAGPDRERHWFWRLLGFLTRPVRRAWSSPDPLDDYALVHMTSAMGDAFFAVALADSVFFSIPVDQARVRVALYLAFTVAPLAAAAPLFVPLLDRAGPRRVMSFAAAVGRAALAIYLAPRTGTLAMFPVAFLMLVLSKAHGIVKNGLTIAYAPTGEGLVRANARLGRWMVAGVTVGAVPAVAVLKTVGVVPVLYAAAGVYIVSGLLNARLPYPKPPEVEREVARGGRLPELTVAAFGAGALRAASGFLVFLFAFALRDEGQPTYWFGVLAAAVAAGGFLGDVVVPHTPRGMREEGLVLSALVVAGAAALAGFEVYGLGALAVFAALAGMATESGRVAFQSLMQRLVPVRAHGRVFVRYEVAFQLAWVAGAFVPAMIPLPFRTGVLLLALFYTAAGVVYLAIPAARGRIEPLGS